MKRFLAIVMVLMLLAGAACAETRESVVYLEGEAEPITETLYETAWGFSIWYDADLLDVDDSMSESGYSLMISPAEYDLPVYMEIMLPQALGTTAWDFLGVNAGKDTEYENLYTDSGTEIIGYTKSADFNDEIIQGFYIATSINGEQAAVYISFPQEMWEGWGTRLLHTMQTITFGPLPAVRADWGEENEDAISVTVSDDEYAVWILFTARRPVSDFQVLALDFNDNYELEAKAAASLGTLKPDRPVRVSLSFYGDIPNNGISFVDEDGAFCRYAVEMSGLDGSLFLGAF
ncbi:MAG: hypothetical protein IK099_05110 [Clostridia bacterium]|nr:hypothetical protein [Clostridia bacterium]